MLGTAAYSLQRAIELMDNSGMLLSDEDSKECSHCLFSFLKTYSWLAAYYFEESVLLFRLRPKHHMMWHHAMQIKKWKLNQSLFHTFDEESFLGKLKQICRACHGRTATQRLYERYLLVFAMLIEGHRRISEKS